jgi:hypothetical protein
MKTAATALALSLLIAAGTAAAGPLDPDCTAEKAAKGAAMKSTVGVGGRCSPKEAAADTAKRTTGMDGDNHKDKAKNLVPGKDKNGN